MKKLVALSLTLMLLLGAACGLAAESNAQIHVAANQSLQMEVPQGYDLKKENVEGAMYASITTDAADKPSFTLSVAYADLTEGPTPGEMTEEDIELAKQLVGSDFFNPDFQVVTAGGGTKFLVINENDTEDDYVLMIANYEGYFVQMYIQPAEGMQVTEADIATALAILTSTELVEY